MRVRPLLSSLRYTALPIVAPSHCRRSYFTQRLMWQYGIRVAFTLPHVDQERTAHNFLRDFQSELPLYLRAGGLVDLLRSWQPSRADLALPAQLEELVIALYEYDVVESADVLLMQAWLADLRDAGYRFPSRATHGLYSAWASRPMENVVASFADESSGGAAGALSLLRAVAPSGSAGDARLSVALFYMQGSAQWMDHSMQASLRQAVPHLHVEFHSVTVRCPAARRAARTIVMLIIVAGAATFARAPQR